MADLPIETGSKPLDVPAYYVDQVTVFDGPWDIILTMGKIVPTGLEESDKPTRVPLCTITMSHTHAKKVVEVLGRVLKQHEKAYGPIQGSDKLAPKGSGS